MTAPSASSAAATGGTEAPELVFLSYAAGDKIAATDLHDRLTELGVPHWFAPAHMRNDATWPSQLEDALRRSRLIVVLLSRDANESEFVRREVTRAAELGLPARALRLEAADTTGDLAILLSGCHLVDAFARHREVRFENLARQLTRPDARGDTLRPLRSRWFEIGPTIGGAALGLAITLALLGPRLGAPWILPGGFAPVLVGGGLAGTATWQLGRACHRRSRAFTGIAAGLALVLAVGLAIGSAWARRERILEWNPSVAEVWNILGSEMKPDREPEIDTAPWFVDFRESAGGFVGRVLVPPLDALRTAVPKELSRRIDMWASRSDLPPRMAILKEEPSHFIDDHLRSHAHGMLLAMSATMTASLLLSVGTTCLAAGLLAARVGRR